MMNIKFLKLNDKAEFPYHGSEHSAGYDLRACLEKEKLLAAGEIAIIDTGIAVEIPENFFGMVCPRSGLAAKYGITVLNSPGIIDSDYRGEIKCIMANHSKNDFVIENGTRLAQIIICSYEKISWTEQKFLSDSKRGPKGLGSTGLR